ncbi:hypothetical protein [Streptomyces triticirhizae]|uniref:Uncharacterized protein n=1 Tax=Streptomyces triticirhizae TaxID=2483353 RepID=A0A3M2LAX5_9ACTN|nr:hypothetical protein [Streptomyces triticirhizae]RMI33095.1 hypothetical protein EBN88_24810 [Streptomyces triticirhizae]
MLGVFSTGLLLGALLSASVLWLASGLAAPLPAGWRAAATVALGALAVARDAGLVRLRLPQNARQVPQDVLQRDLVRGALQFGFEMGTGVRTYVSASLPYALAAGVLLANDGGVALATGLGFALGRAATPTLRFASGAGEEWDDRLIARLPLLTTGAAAAATAAWAVLALRG